MFKNYIKVALRNLWKNRIYSGINIIGLSAGLAVCLLIVLYVFDELSYDKYNTKADRIYRLNTYIHFNGTEMNAGISPEPFGATLMADNPQVEQIARVNGDNYVLVKKGDQKIQDRHLTFADSTFFEVFTAEFIQGNFVSALKKPGSVVINESTAKKYFNSTDVVGKTIIVDDNTLLNITGVIKDFPSQSHFHFNFIRPLIDTWRGGKDQWLSNNWHTYILVKPGVTQAFMQGRVNDEIIKHVYAQMQTQFHASMNDIQKQGNYFRYKLMPLTQVHLISGLQYEFEPGGSITYVYIFSVIAVLILLIACVNFMNLSTARSASRAKEVGIRKVAGSLRSQLIIQFLAESILLSFISLIIALALAAGLLPFFNQLAAKQMHIAVLFSSWLLPVLLAFILIVGCVAGSYPAFYLSSFKPVQVLKGAIAAGFKASWLRSSLVVFQFCISIMLIAGTIVIYNQLTYMRGRDAGFNRQQVLILHNTYSLDKQIKTFRGELKALPGVQNATITSYLPTGGNRDQDAFFTDATLNAQKAVVMESWRVDENYIPTLSMKMAQGRPFNGRQASDSNGVIINEAALKVLGFTNPLNKKLYRPGDSSESLEYHIIGVVKNFNFSSMHDDIGPVAMLLQDDWGSIAVRVNTNDMQGFVAQVESKWKRMGPGFPFSYSFMDSDFNNIYQVEQQTGKLFISFAIFAIFIACLGLFGLVTFAAEQRAREIGIRKVLGANVSSIVAMLGKDFAKLVLVASVIALPVAWWAMHTWLQGFAYRVNISWWVFVVPGIAALFIALFTVSFQAVKAALANPVKSLRAQ